MTLWPMCWRVTAAALILVTVGCAHPSSPGPPTPPTVTPADVKKWTAVARSVTLFVCGVTEAQLPAQAGPACPGAAGLSIAATKEIVADTRAADLVLDAAQTGWQAAVKTAWAEAMVRIGPVSNTSIKIALAGVTAILDIVLDGTRPAGLRRAT